MDKELAQAYRRRWQAVEQIEQEEMRNATTAQRWRQLNALLHLYRKHQMMPYQEDVEEVRRRWIQLKSKMDNRVSNPS